MKRSDRRSDSVSSKNAATSEDFQRTIPPVTFEPDLPVSQRVDEIRDTIANNRVTIVCGETGSGKSTQLPKLLLEMGYGHRKRIGHTQPRRLAARSVAERVAQELKTPLGETVGYKIRFGDKTSRQTAIKLMTDGILLAEVPHDRWLNQYDAIILDEAHERSLNIDLLIGVLMRILVKRTDMRLVVTSATIDAERIAEHFSSEGRPAPIVTVSGRTWPVEILYRPFGESVGGNSDGGQSQPDDRDVFSAIGDAVEELNRSDPGDMLIFLPTEQDIRLATRHLRGIASQGRMRDTEILPLYARLSGQDQNRIFRPGKQARIILSTNVAESSLTVPRIKHVIDTGTARMSRYSPRSKVQRLPIEPVSQASANQRAGRCGRLEPGTCIRLFSEADFLSRDEFTTPEIRRTNLASVILQIKTMKLGEIEQIPFLDPPNSDAVRAGYSTLFEVGATDDHRKLTELGRKLSRFPIDPRLSRMMIAADDEGCLADILIIASALEVRDPRERPVEKQQAADEAHAKFKDEQSDFVGLLKMWDFFHELKSSLSQNRFRKACAQNFLSYNRIREWQDVQRQLRKSLDQIGMKAGSRSNDFGKIHRALLTGLLSGVAMKGDSHEFTGAGGGKFFLWPGSSVFGKPSKWIVASEMVETGKRYLRNVARIDPAWIERIAAHLIKRNYNDPHFSTKQAACMAYEKLTLYGLPVVPNRRVHYGRIDPVVSRDIFIEQGLVESGWRPQQGVIAENCELLESLGNLAHKTRERELVVDPGRVAQFYQTHIPEDVYDARSLERWLKKASKERRAELKMSMSDLTGDADWRDAEAQFPDQLPVGTLNVPLDYRFEPGGRDDGVTIRLPVEAVRQLNPRQIEWLVPGMVERKITAMIRCLPKALRRNLVPAPDTAKKVAADIEFGKGIFSEVVALHLSRLSGQTIRGSDFQMQKVDEHLLLNIELTDEEGKTVAAGRDLKQLRGEVDVQIGEIGEITIHQQDSQWHRDGLTSWDFDELPSKIEISRQPISVFAYPALIDRGDRVDLRLLDSRSEAKQANVRGISRLYAIAARKAIVSQVRWLPDYSQMQVFAASICPGDSFEQQLIDLVSRRAFVDTGKLPSTKSDFQLRLDEAAERTSIAAQDIARVLPRLFQLLHTVRLEIEQTDPKRWSASVSDIDAQLDFLLREGFLARTPWRWLSEYPRFLNAIIQRLEKLPQRGRQEDGDFASEVAMYVQQYTQRQNENAAMGVIDAELEQFRWMVEEYRVSLFAQSLGTSLKVSPQRLEKQWEKALQSIAEG